MIVAGIGCRKGVSAAAVLAAIDAALAAQDLQRDAVEALAAPISKAQEAAIHDAAQALAVPLSLIGQEALADVETRLLSRSSQSRAATGSGSASEAAALVVAGPAARLLGPRLATGPVTCALAIGEDPR